MPRDFRLHVFHESVFHNPSRIPVVPFQIFSKIRGDIHSSMVQMLKIFQSEKFKKEAESEDKNMVTEAEIQ